MLKSTIALLALLSLILAGCRTTCADGTTSRSHGSGTCSHHGGVAR